LTDSPKIIYIPFLDRIWASPVNSVFIVGLGDIGEHILELLVRVPGIAKIYTADIRKEESLRKVYSARSGAIHQVFIQK